MSTTPHRFPPWSVPRLGDMVKGADQRVMDAMRELELFLYSLTYGQVQGLESVASPTLVNGDTIFRHGVGDVRLPIGDEGEVLTIVDGLPDWEPPFDPLHDVTFTAQGAGVYDPMLVRILEMILLRLRELRDQLQEILGKSSHDDVRTTTVSTLLATVDKTILADAALGNIVVTLPPAGTSKNQVFHVKKIDTGSYFVEVSGREQIDTRAYSELRAKGAAISFTSDGSRWWVLGRYPQSTLLDGLRAWWTLDEVSGTRYDATRRGNDFATIVGSDTPSVAAVVRGGLSRAGGSVFGLSQDTLPADLQVGGVTYDFSFMSWFTLQDKTTNRRQIEWHDAVGAKFHVTYHSAGNNIDLSIGVTPDVITVFNNPVVGTWYCYYVQWKVSTTTFTIRLWEPNGTSYEASLSYPAGAPVCTKLRFGASWYGYTDETAFWQRLLTTDEQAEFRNNGAGIGYPG